MPLRSSPRLSLVIFAYNQEDFVTDAIESAFAQDCKNIEIILSDDCSTDGTYEVMEKLALSYSGIHTIRLLPRASKNVGLIEHLNRVFSVASGEWIVLCAGDDASKPTRCSDLLTYITENPSIAGVFSGFLECDEKLSPIREVLPERNKLVGVWNLCRHGGYLFPGAAFAIRRDCFDYFGTLDPRVRAEDWVLPLRSAILGDLGFLNKSLILKRNLDHSLTSVNHAYSQSSLKDVFSSPERTANNKTIQDSVHKTLMGSTKARLLSAILYLHACTRVCAFSPGMPIRGLVRGFFASILLCRLDLAIHLTKRIVLRLLENMRITLK